MLKEISARYLKGICRDLRFLYSTKTNQRLRQRGEKTIVKEHQSACGSAAWVAHEGGLSAGGAKGEGAFSKSGTGHNHKLNHDARTRG